MKKLCIIQPLLSNYSRQTFLEIAAFCDVDIVFSPTPSGKGFGKAPEGPEPRVRYFVAPTLRPLGSRVGMIQWGLAKHLFKTRPDALLVSSDPRLFSFWTTLVVARLLGIPAHAHGHGVYRKSRISTLYRLMVSALLRLCTTYICYAPIVRDSFVENGFDARKLRVAHNSLTNAWTVKPEEKSGNETGVLFVGRLRQDSRVEVLVGTVRRLSAEGVPVTLHVIGSGELESHLKREAGGTASIVFHGEIYDPERVREISRLCSLGCYPGNAGLSVVHLMSLSLPVVTQNNMRTHGPEASFVRNGQNGILFDHRHPAESLYEAIKRLALDRGVREAMQREAYATYEKLVNPPLSERLWSIVNADLEERKHRSPQNPSWAAKTPSIGSQPKTGKP